MDNTIPWPERTIPYAYAAAAYSALGCILGIWIGLFFRHTHEWVATLSATGFVAGLLIGPAVRYLRRSKLPSGAPTLESAAEAAGELDEAAHLAQVADSSLPYAFASALGATLACLGGIGVFAITRGRFGSLAYFCAGGFILGTLAGFTLITIYRGLTGALREQNARQGGAESKPATA